MRSLGDFNFFRAAIFPDPVNVIDLRCYLVWLEGKMYVISARALEWFEGNQARLKTLAYADWYDPENWVWLDIGTDSSVLEFRLIQAYRQNKVGAALIPTTVGIKEIVNDVFRRMELPADRRWLAFREFMVREGMVKAELFPASWKDPYEAINTEEDYDFLFWYTSMCQSLNKAIQSQSFVLLQGLRNQKSQKLLEWFFDYHLSYPDEGEAFFLHAAPGCTYRSILQEFCDLLAVEYSPSLDQHPAVRARIHKAIQKLPVPPVVCVMQALMMSNSAVDEIFLLSEHKVPLILVNCNRELISRLQTLGVDTEKYIKQIPSPTIPSGATAILEKISGFSLVPTPDHVPLWLIQPNPQTTIGLETLARNLTPKLRAALNPGKVGTR